MCYHDQLGVLTNTVMTLISGACPYLSSHISLTIDDHLTQGEHSTHYIFFNINLFIFFFNFLILTYINQTVNSGVLAELEYGWSVSKSIHWLYFDKCFYIKRHEEISQVKMFNPKKRSYTT